MRDHRSIQLIPALAMFLVSGIAIPVAARSTEVRGEVVEIRPATAVENHGELDQLTIRTRTGETHRLLLGEPGSCPGSLAAGDRVRARVMAEDGAGESRRVRSMYVRRTGESFKFRNKSGEMVRARDGSSAVPGDGRASRRRVRSQDRAPAAGGSRGRVGAGGGRR